MKFELLLMLAVTAIASTETDSEKKVFVPTNEWKVIEEGQAIPPGLHVRINLQTGKKEAKLLDTEDQTEDKNSAALVPMQDDTDPPNDDPEAIHSRLKDALKNIPDEGFEYSEEKLKEITKKFRTYESMKQDFEEMNMKIKSDFQLMSELLEKYQLIKDESELDVNEYRTLFEDLEYLLHQIDNANDFVTAGGLEKIILPNLGNQTVRELRIHSVKLLGILVQNNPKGQIAAFERNVGSILLQMVAQSGNISTNELSSLIFAIGGLLRKFPLAQTELLNNPGLNILVDLLGKHVDFKIKMKCLLLLTDLIREFDERAENVDVSKVKPYAGTDIKSRLLTTEYCTSMIDLMLVHRQDYSESLYIADDLLNVLIASKEICEPQWGRSSIFRHTLLAIKTNFEQQNNATNFDNAELNGVVEKLDRLQVFSSNHAPVNDEL